MWLGVCAELNCTKAPEPRKLAAQATLTMYRKTVFANMYAFTRPTECPAANVIDCEDRAYTGAASN